MTAFIIHVPDSSTADEETIQEHLSSIIEPTSNEISDGQAKPPTNTEIRVTTATRHSDWERGDSCPECGSTELSVLIPVEDIYHSDDGVFDFRRNGDYLASPVSIQCLECHENLMYKPYEEL